MSHEIDYVTVLEDLEGLREKACTAPDGGALTCGCKPHGEGADAGCREIRDAITLITEWQMELERLRDQLSGDFPLDDDPWDDYDN